MSLIDIHEFRRGFRNIHQKNGILVSGGYEKEVVSENYPVPEKIKKAVTKHCFRIHDSYPPENGELALIARDIDEYSVLAVANSVPEDGTRPAIAYRYFWLEKPKNIDGIGTLLLWWIKVGKPYFSFEKYENSNISNYSGKIPQPQEFDYYFPQIKDLISKVSSYPFVLTAENQNERKIPEYTAWHCLALVLNQEDRNRNQEEHNQLAWAWNVTELHYPQYFNLICCADTHSYTRISNSIKQSRPRNFVNSVQSQLGQKLLTGSTNTTEKFVDQTNNTLLNKVKRCIKDLSTSEKPQESKFLELIDYLEAENESIANCNWEEIIDQTTLTHNNDSTARYKALLAILYPEQKFFLVWLSMLQENQEYSKTSLSIQTQLLKISSSKDRKIVVNYLNNNINTYIILLLLKAIDSINETELLQIEWLLIQSKSFWTTYFDKYANKLLPKLIRREPDINNDVFYDEILKTWEEWQSQKYQYIYTDYKTIAKLFGKKGKYNLSAFFYQLSEGKVPSDIAEKIEADFFPMEIDSNKKKTHGFFPFSKLLVGNKKLLTFLILSVVALVGGIVIVAWFVPPNFIKDIIEPISSKQPDSLGDKQDRGTHDTVKPVGSFFDTWNQWKQTGDTQAKKLIIQDLQSQEPTKFKEIFEFIRNNLTPQVKILYQDSTKTKDIKTVQEILKIEGYYLEDINGDLNLTKNAFKKFQQSQRITSTNEINKTNVKPLLDYFIDKQVKLVKELLLNSFQTRNNDNDIKKDIQDLQKCRTDAATSLLKYKPCIDKIMNNVNGN